VRGHHLGLAECLRLCQPHRAHRARVEHTLAAGDATRHAERPAGDVTPVVDRVGDRIEVEQLAELAVELEARLILAEVGVLATTVGADELGAIDDLVDDRRHVVLPAAGAAEVEELLARGVLAEEPTMCRSRSRSARIGAGISSRPLKRRRSGISA